MKATLNSEYLLVGWEAIVMEDEGREIETRSQHLTTDLTFLRLLHLKSTPGSLPIRLTKKACSPEWRGYCVQDGLGEEGEDQNRNRKGREPL